MGQVYDVVPAEAIPVSEAVQVHGEIIANGRIAAGALAEMCKGLKRMRDEQLYKDLGCATFDDYCNGMTNIKARQAYTYIAAYERLGADVLQSNATLGITKLELLSQLPVSIRDELLAAPEEIADMSASELKKLTAELDASKNQVDMLTGETERQKKENDDLAAKIREQKDSLAKKKEAERKLAKAEERIKELEAERGQPRAEESAQVDIETAIADALEQERERHAAELAQMDKRIKLSGADAVTVKLYLAEIKSAYEKTADYIAEDPDTLESAKFRGALIQLLHMCYVQAVEEDEEAKK